MARKRTHYMTANLVASINEERVAKVEEMAAYWQITKSALVRQMIDFQWDAFKNVEQAAD